MEALLKAVMEGDEGQVARLLDSDPTLLEGPKHRDTTPLRMAAVRGQLGVVKLLVERGVDVDATGPSDVTALHCAAYQGHEEMVKFLLSKGAQASSLSEGMTPLGVAASRGHLDVVRVLIQNVGKQGLQDADEEGHTALHWAAHQGQEEVVAYLLGQGAQAHSADSNKMTPLMLACAQGLVGVMQAFYNHMGVQALQATDKDGYTPLHVASMRSHEKMVAFLLGQGAQTNSRDRRGMTPLVMAGSEGHVAVLRVLLQHMGAQVLQGRDEDGYKSLYMALLAGHEEAVAFLLGQGAQASTELLMLAAAKGKIGVARLLIQHMRAQDALQETVGEGYTALHWAAMEGHVEIVRLLLLAGADPTITDNEGWTPRALVEEEGEEEDEEQGNAEGRAECVAVFEWWEGELERRHVLHRATCLHKATTTQPDLPTSQVSTYLQARVAAGRAVPRVVVSPQAQRPATRSTTRQAEASGKRKAEGESGNAQGAEPVEEEERHAMLQYVVSALNEELVTELLEGFPCEK